MGGKGEVSAGEYLERIHVEVYKGSEEGYKIFDGDGDGFIDWVDSQR